MKRFTTLTVLAAAIVLLAQCSPKPKAAMTSTTPPAPAKNSMSRFAVGFSTAESEKGKVVYQDNCGRCHKLFTPESRTLKQWEHILPEMYEKGKIDHEKTHLIDAYVAANAKSN